VFLGTCRATTNTSGYCYVYVPKHLARMFNISRDTKFLASYADGRLILTMESKNAVQLGDSSTAS